MFKRSFFLVLVLAGLCFGETSEDGVSSGGSSGSGTEDKKVETQSPEGEDSSDGQSDSGTNRETLELLNEKVPNFVGNYKKKKNLLLSFIASCGTNQMHVASLESKTLVNKERTTTSSSAINLVSVDFPNCTFVCKPPNNGDTFRMNMPKNTPCDKFKNTCPGDGPCPTPPVPTC
uniref:Putative secreted salivary gland peptide n=1 Tax=Ixodes scapularis TaxID=6945 RepID=Q5Q993_IXOSC|nr:putative secreted salivary gland peptide [Ixodes scapularis]